MIRWLPALSAPTRNDVRPFSGLALSYDRVVLLVRRCVILLAAISTFLTILWLSIAIHALFYDSEGTYRQPTLSQILHNAVIGLLPFAVPVVLVFLFYRLRNRETDATKGLPAGRV